MEAVALPYVEYWGQSERTEAPAASSSSREPNFGAIEVILWSAFHRRSESMEKCIEIADLPHLRHRDISIFATTKGVEKASCLLSGDSSEM
jgi:hypothetical protein